MKFGLQSDIPDRALPETLRSLIVQQTEALATLLLKQYAQDTSDAIQANKDITAHEKAQRLALLADETSQRLGALERQNVEMERQIARGC
jgi:hypothetical protein